MEAIFIDVIDWQVSASGPWIRSERKNISMSSTPAVNILHLSDIHFGSEHHFRQGSAQVGTPNRSSLIELIAEDLHEFPAPDLVVISGDLTSRALREEFDFARDFLSELSNICKISRNQFLIIPGNHDLLWGADKTTVSMGEYESFYSNFLNVPVSDALMPSRRVRDTFVLGLDSTRILSQISGGIGHVGSDQLRIAGSKINNEAKDVKNLVLVMHHHLLPVAWIEPAAPNAPVSMTIDAPSIIAWAQANKACMLLHGHQHQPFLTTVHYADRLGGPLLIAGCASGGGKDLPPQGRNGYQWLHFEGRNIKVSRRELGSDNKFKTLDEVSFVHEQTGMFGATAIPEARTIRDTSVEEIRGLIRATCSRVEDAVSQCYGPSGGLSAVSRVGGSTHIRDGYSLLRAQITSDPIQKRILTLFQDLANTVGNSIGDGRKTAALIAAVATSKGLTAVANGCQDNVVASDLLSAADLACKFISKMSRPIDDNKRGIEVIAYTASGLQTESQEIVNLCNVVGNCGYINFETQVEKAENEHINATIIEYNFEDPKLPDWLEDVLKEDRAEHLVENPACLVYDGVISSYKQLLPALEYCKNRPCTLLVFCQGIQGDAHEIVMSNSLGGNLTAIPVTFTGVKASGMLEDIAVLTNARYFKDSELDNYATCIPCDFGNAKSLTLCRNWIQVTPQVSKPTESRIRDAVRKLRLRRQSAINHYESDILSGRLARLTGGVGRIVIMGPSENELRIRAGLVSDAMSAIRNSIESGCVPGGGVTLAYASKCLAKVENLGAGGVALFESLNAPIRLTGVEMTSDLLSCLAAGNWEIKTPLDPLTSTIGAIRIAADLAARLIRTRTVEPLASGEDNVK